MAIDTTSDNLNPLSGYFWGNSPNVNQQLRQRLAMQMMSHKKGFPKNIGEGLSAIGDSIGDIGLAKMLERSDQANTAAANSKRDEMAAVPAAAPVNYAPPDQVAPAVSAIERAINPEDSPDTAPAPDMLTAPPPAQPSSMLSPTMPSGLGGLAPAPTPSQSGSLLSPQPTMAPPAQAGGEGGYNMLDAQADMGRTPGPGYVQDAIQGSTQDPDMQAYLSQLVKKEAPNGPRDTSSTGAAGPYQFTRGTGRQYGLVGAGGDQRENLAASSAAALKLTQDNAAIFAKINGRPPTMAELALMHQQGGGTGARMVAGTGNAPPGNLAVNNISPQANPAQAVAGIKKYYGMPDTVVDPRAGIAAVLAQRSGVPQTNPTEDPASPDGGPPTRLAFSGQPSNVQSDISQAPPFAPSIRQAPPQQVAQAAPSSGPPPAGYITPPAAYPVPPKAVPIDPRETAAVNELARHPGDPAWAAALGPTIQKLQADRAFKQNQLEDDYKAARKQAEELNAKREDQSVNAAQLKQTYEKGARALEQDVRFGGMSPQFYEQAITASHTKLAPLADSGDAINRALSMANKGMFTGVFANAGMAKARVLEAMGFPVDPRISITQQFEAATAPIWAAARAAQAGGANISDADIANAKRSVAGDITLDAATFPGVLRNIQKMQEKAAIWHQGMLGKVAGDDENASNLMYATHGLDMARIIPPEKQQLLRNNPTPEVIAEFNRHYNTPGLAQRILGVR